MEMVVILQLTVLLRSHIVYSSVLQMNAVRQGGLVCAAMNGIYALYVLHHFGDDHPTCATSSAALLGQGGSASGSSGASARLVSDYTTFFCLLAVNGLGVLYGASSADRI